MLKIPEAMASAPQPIGKSSVTINQNYDSKRAGEHIVQIGKERFALKSDHPRVHLTGIEKYDKLLNDFEITPHTFIQHGRLDGSLQTEQSEM